MRTPLASVVRGCVSAVSKKRAGPGATSTLRPEAGLPSTRKRQARRFARDEVGGHRLGDELEPLADRLEAGGRRISRRDEELVGALALGQIEIGGAGGDVVGACHHVRRIDPHPAIASVFLAGRLDVARVVAGLEVRRNGDAIGAGRASRAAYAIGGHRQAASALAPPGAQLGQPLRAGLVAGLVDVVPDRERARASAVRAALGRFFAWICKSSSPVRV